MGPLLFLLLPALACCHIIVTIQTSNSSSTSSVNIQGTQSDIISDNEQTTYGITDEVLKNAVQKISGGRPQDVFLHSPTPWNDLYQTYGWKEVNRVLKPVNGRILDVQSENVVVNLKKFDNNSTNKVTFDENLMKVVEDSIQNKWNKAGILTIQKPISYIVNGRTTFSFSSPWGSDTEQSKELTIGSNANVHMFLEPGQSVSAALTATKVTMTVQIDYTASLSGHVACNYPKKYNGHHFWRYEINELLRASGLIKSVNSSEVIRIQFYTDANVVVTDKRTNAKISEVSAEFN